MSTRIAGAAVLTTVVSSAERTVSFVIWQNGMIRSSYPAPMADAVATHPLSGRRAQAARNDERILQAAREVFVANPEAPIADVAKRAGVGISALYRRYPSKQDLLRKLCADGLQRYIEAVQAAVDDDGDPWQTFARFMRRAVEADSNSLTLRLAGTFTPTPELFEMAEHAQELNRRLFERTKQAGALRPDADVNDVAAILEQVASLRFGDTERTKAIRQRYLAIALDGLCTPEPSELPAPPPTWQEVTARWQA
jgi:AcrR family transcriptional regulator